MVLQNYLNCIEMTSNMIYIVALRVGLKFLRKTHLNTQCPACLRSMFKAMFPLLNEYNTFLIYQSLFHPDVNREFLANDTRVAALERVFFKSDQD